MYSRERSLAYACKYKSRMISLNSAMVSWTDVSSAYAKAGLALGPSSAAAESAAENCSENMSFISSYITPSLFPKIFWNELEDTSASFRMAAMVVPWYPRSRNRRTLVESTRLRTASLSYLRAIECPLLYSKTTKFVYFSAEKHFCQIAFENMYCLPKII